MEKTKQIRTRKSSKFVFVLKNINTEQIDKKYGITLISNITQSTSQPNNTTTLDELIEISRDKSLDIVSFLDESKRLYQCNVSMINFESRSSIDNFKGYKCYWCRHIFDTVPIGCPIRYVSSRAIKSYHSEVTKDDYTINENITKYKRDKFEGNKELFISKNKANISVNKEEYYETDGVFCSFNCCKAYIKDNKHNKLYDHSDNLLIKLYKDINNNSTENIKINPAPSWRLLADYGGHLSIEKFRENFNKYTYEYHGKFIKYVFKPMGMLYEEKINF